MRSLVFASLMVIAAPSLAHAAGDGVGLGVAAGVAYSGSEITVHGAKEALGARFAWGFFVDIPLLPTFYITPQTMIYEVRGEDGLNHSVTDVDLNFKFIVPIGDLHLGAGVTGGFATGLDRRYVPHWGLLGFGSYNLVANLDAFLMVQYKKQMLEDASDISDIHGFAGGMFRF